MTKSYILKLIVSSSLLLTASVAQENVDAIEKARQAKEAADKAAAEAAAATEAAIEAAAAKAAKEAREEAKRKKEEEDSGISIAFWLFVWCVSVLIGSWINS